MLIFSFISKVIVPAKCSAGEFPASRIFGCSAGWYTLTWFPDPVNSNEYPKQEFDWTLLDILK